MSVSRRSVLWGSVVAVWGVSREMLAAQGLDAFTVSAPPCPADPRVTPVLARDTTYRPGAPKRTSLVEPGTAGTRMVLSGTVTGVTCGRIPGARVEIWHADHAGAYDATGFRFRGHQLTSAEGGFRFQTVVPGAATGRAKRIGLRVVVTGKADMSTELFFPGDPHNARDSRFRNELLLRPVHADAGQAVIFDVVLGI